MSEPPSTTGSEKRECGFCHGQPVGNAREWTSGQRLPACACPRCGVRTPFDWEKNLTAEEHDELVPRGFE